MSTGTSERRIPPPHQHGLEDIPVGWGPGYVPSSEALQSPEGAEHIGYDNTSSGLTATDVQEAIDELATASANPAAVTLLETDFGLVTVDSATSLPANAIPIECSVTVNVPLSMGATIAVGKAGGSITLLQLTTDNNPQLAGTYIVPLFGVSWGAGAAPVRITIGGAPVAGAGTVRVLYSAVANA